jgi:hypothetical protein
MPTFELCRCCRWWCLAVWSLVSRGRHESEEQVGGLGFEGDVADLVDDQERVAPSRTSSCWSLPAWWASASRATHSLAVANRTRCPAWQARIAIPMARWVLPVPGGPRKTTFSFAATKSRVPRCSIRSRLRPRAWSKSNSSKDLRAGNRAARIRPSPPWDFRADTSRCRQATRNSSWLQDSARARSANRGTASSRGRRLQRPGQEGHLAGQVALRSSRGLAGGHDANPPSVLKSGSMPRSMPRAVS